MSLTTSYDRNMQERSTSLKAPIKCKIPQRRPNQYRTSTKEKIYAEPMQPPASGYRDLMSSQNTRNYDRERLMATLPKKTTYLKRKVKNETCCNREALNLPLMKNFARTKHTINTIRALPDKKAIQQSEYSEIDQNDQNEDSSATDINKESINMYNEEVQNLKSDWNLKNSEFQKMKNELNSQQHTVVELYATIKKIHEKLVSVGETVNLPSSEQLHIMNLGMLSPELLLALCAKGSCPIESHKNGERISMLLKEPLPIDVNKLYSILKNLVETCEQTVGKRKDVVDWLDSLLKTKTKEVNTNVIFEKIKEFTDENEMLDSLLETVKTELYKKFQEITSFIKKSGGEIMALEVRMQKSSNTIQEISTQNADLRKQLQKMDHFKSYNNRVKIEELEKELKEEKNSKVILRERMCRAEGQVKASVERVKKLEAALDQACSERHVLENTIQQLQEENQKLQNEFDIELHKLNESVKENSQNLEDIAETREKLQTEKDELQKRLDKLSKYYKEAMENMRNEVNSNFNKLIESDKKYNDVMGNKEVLEKKVESLSGQLLATELRYKEIVEEIQQKEDCLKFNVIKLETIKKNLEEEQALRKSYTKQLQDKEETLENFKTKLRESMEAEENVKCDINTKIKYIEELEKKNSLLEQQLLESEQKMESYDKQMVILKDKLTNLQEEFREFESIDEVRNALKHHETKLNEISKENLELSESLQKKNVQLGQKDTIINALKEKEKEQAKIIQLLRNNLEIRNEMEANFSRQLSDNNKHIETLMNELAQEKNQISELEKIILTLEEKTRQQHKMDRERIISLEKKILYEKRNGPEDVEHIIEILESELDFEPQLHSNMKYPNERSKKGRNIENYDYREDSNSLYYKLQQERAPSKIVTGNFIKTTYLPKQDKMRESYVDYKKSNTKMHTEKVVPSLPFGISISKSLQTYDKEFINNHDQGHQHYQQSNIPAIIENIDDEKKYKMFKFAGHKL